MRFFSGFLFNFSISYQQKNKKTKQKTGRNIKNLNKFKQEMMTKPE